MKQFDVVLSCYIEASHTMSHQSSCDTALCCITCVCIVLLDIIVNWDFNILCHPGVVFPIGGFPFKNLIIVWSWDGIGY